MIGAGRGSTGKPEGKRIPGWRPKERTIDGGKNRRHELVGVAEGKRLTTKRQQTHHDHWGGEEISTEKIIVVKDSKVFTF